MDNFITIGSHIIALDALAAVELKRSYPYHTSEYHIHLKNSNSFIEVTTDENINNLIEYKKENTVKKLEHIINEKDKIIKQLKLQIEYMPPNLGGSGYQAAKQDFESYQKN